MKTENDDFELNDEGKSFINVSDDMRLVMTARNWQLQKKLIAGSDTKTQKKGDINWSAFRYYMTLDSALNDIIHIMTSKEIFNDAKGLIEADAKVIKHISSVFSANYELIKK